MSEKSCNKCACGQVASDRPKEIQLVAVALCNSCILKSNFIKGHAVGLVNPPVKDSRIIKNVCRYYQRWADLAEKNINGNYIV